MNWLARLFHSSKIDRIEKETQEVRHDLKNVRMRTDALKLLILRMRQEGFTPDQGLRHD